jgi:cystathionine beta-lyase/cystathionine gamma-synthase
VQENTRVLYLESPTSHNFELQDIRLLTQWAHEHGLTVICDNSYGSPLNRKPVEFGVDIICHSASKYIGGHSDVLAGVVCSSSRIINRMYYDEYMTLGAMISPENAWLLIRSLRTLPLRLETASSSCKTLVSYLHNDYRISKVIWPFDSKHPQHHLAIEQFDTEGPLFAFELNTANSDQVKVFCDSLKIIQMAVSWGGYESLIMPAMVLPATTLPIGHLRLYVGMEETQSLIQDISQALDKVFHKA